MRFCEYEQCGASLEGRARHARFCSRDCQVAAYRSGPSYRSAALGRRQKPAIRVPHDLYDRLGIEAYARQMSVQEFTRRLLTESLDRLVPAEELRLVRKTAS